VVIFFFQAEDGIRDFHVTGVQTCALPISILLFNPKYLISGTYTKNRKLIEPTMTPIDDSRRKFIKNSIAGITAFSAGAILPGFRSEERRVGKECRSRARPGAEVTSNELRT